VFARVKDFQLQDLTQTIGAGLLAKTPIGPVRIDFAFPILNRPDSEKRYRIHFTFGQTF
jgi:outer membrane protein assembly factor BamA